MLDGSLLAAALLCNIVGLAWLALGMQVHWQQVTHRCALEPQTLVLLRTLGAAGLVTSLILCLQVDHISMASLVWVMALSAAALVVAFTLTWWPRTFAPLVAWVRPGREGVVEDSSSV